VTHGTRGLNGWESNLPFGESDRQFVSVLHNETEGSPTAGARWKLFREHPRQDFENQIGNPAVTAESDRAVLPMVFRRGVNGIGVLPVKMIPELVTGNTRKDDDGNDDGPGRCRSQSICDRDSDFRPNRNERFPTDPAFRRQAQLKQQGEHHAEGKIGEEKLTHNVRIGCDAHHIQPESRGDQARHCRQPCKRGVAQRIVGRGGIEQAHGKQ
jgi:hypothetical protein